LKRKKSELLELAKVALDQRNGVLVLIAQLLGQQAAIHARLALASTVRTSSTNSGRVMAFMGRAPMPGIMSLSKYSLAL
jgi:hypothetical protein